MGDRGGRQTFPRLERMTIRARPALLPSRYGWDTPSLTRLNVLVDAGGLEEAATSIEQWIRGYDHPQPRHRRNVPILAQLWQQCPALQEVIFTLSRWSKESNHEFSQERKSLDWIRIEPTWTVDWSVTRELLLPMVKPVVSAEVPTERPTDLQMDASTDDVSTDRGPTGGSTLSMLSKEVLPEVLSYLAENRGSPPTGWKATCVMEPSTEANRLLELLGLEGSPESEEVAEAGAKLCSQLALPRRLPRATAGDGGGAAEDGAVAATAWSNWEPVEERISTRISITQRR
mmetsp:Transcript_20044/g.42214  ORF Transcript_20044/g.42214 Transcript_20044/m.42214 type:complete len:288 (+) Transcript_20044:703-1566(+)